MLNKLTTYVKQNATHHNMTDVVTAAVSSYDSAEDSSAFANAIDPVLLNQMLPPAVLLFVSD